jgi:hypothetical protein
MLSWRSKTLEFFRLECEEHYLVYPLPAPEESDKRILLGLIADGMEIDLGPVTSALHSESPQE